MNEFNIIWKDIDELKAYENNVKIHDDIQVENIAKSIKKFKWRQPIVIDKNNVVVIGHGRLEAAKLLGETRVPCNLAEDLTDEEIKELRLVDNKLNESLWDLDAVAKERENTDLSDFTLDWGDIIEEIEEEAEKDNPYSKKVKTPQYEITGAEPMIEELVDTSKTDDLVYEIMQADIEEETRDFLIKAAQRHLVFNYRNIAEFYAHQDADVQRLMEKSALVIIDIDDAIANGFVKLTKAIEDIIEDESDA